MSLLPDSASFHEKVQDAFVAYRGSGVSLSAADLELLDDWASREVPFEVVARGLRKAAEAALWDSLDGVGRLRTLKGCRKQVEAEIGKFLRQTAGRTAAPSEAPEEPFHLTRHKKLVAALKKATKPDVPAWVSRLEAPADFTGGDRQEQLALGLLCRTLPFPRRIALLREARALMEKASAMSAATRRESLKFHRAALVRQAWSMASLW
jgi:hypothetical protein